MCILWDNLRSVIRESLGIAKIDFSKPPEVVQPQTSEEPMASMETVLDAQSTNTDNAVASDCAHGALAENVDSAEKKGGAPPRDTVQRTLDQNAVRQDAESAPTVTAETEKEDDVGNGQQDTAKVDELNGDDMMAIEDDGDLLADDMDIHSMTDEERVKMKKELGIDAMIVGVFGVCNPL